jgi:SAM-dependent methyltransferase
MTPSLGAPGNSVGGQRAVDRSAAGCLCCGSSKLQLSATVVSPYLAYKAWGGEPELTTLATCNQCGFRFYTRDFTEVEASAYYREYRTEAYYEERHHFEPFYTRRVHTETEKWLASDARRRSLSAVLTQSGAPSTFASVLDYGGGTGALMRDLPAARKAVFEVSEVTPEGSLEHLKFADQVGTGWELVLSAQVLEHVAEPAQLVEAMVAAAKPGGFLYLEVPHQTWREPFHFRLGREAWLRFLCHHPRLLLAADVYSTAFRVKTGVLPPYGFVPMREHLNFFTLEGLEALASRMKLQIVFCQRDSLGSQVVVGRKR